jgi:exopolysaccharide production protein ExoQ
LLFGCSGLPNPWVNLDNALHFWQHKPYKRKQEKLPNQGANLYCIHLQKWVLRTAGKKTRLISNLKRTLASHSPVAQVLSLVGLLTPVAALYASKGIIILFGLTVTVCLLSFITKKGTRSSSPTALGLSVLALTIWGVASLIWTVSFDLSLTVARSLPIIMLGGLLLIMSLQTLNSSNRAIVSRSTISGFFLGISLALIEVTTDYSISKIVHIVKYGGAWSHYMPGFVINNGISLLVMLLWPTLMFLCYQKHQKLAFIGFTITVYVAAQSLNFAATIAIGVGSLSFLVAFFTPRLIYRVAAIGLTLLVLGAPFVMKALPDAQTIGKDLPELSYSVYPRLVIWQYAANLVMEKPLLGHGIRTSRALSKSDTQIAFLYRDKGETLTGNTKDIPLHPHSGLIQIWLELGAAGAVLGLALILCILGGISRSSAPPMAKALAFAALVSSLCLISVSYGLWQSWWVASLWLQGSLMKLSLVSQEDEQPL